MALEALGAAVDERFHTIRVFGVYHIDKGGVDPSTCLDAVQSAYDNLKLQVEIFVEVLYLAVIGRDLDTFHPPLDELGSYFGFEFPYVRMAEEKLAVKVGNVDRIWSSTSAFNNI